MSHRLDEKSLTQLKAFVHLIQQNTDVLHAPELKFFKDFLVGMNATIPPIKKKETTPVEEVDDDMEDVKTTPPKPQTPREKKEPPKEPPKEKKEPPQRGKSRRGRRRGRTRSRPLGC